MCKIKVTTITELTIDGKLSLAPNESSKRLFDYYGDELRTWFHSVRAEYDAIMVGAGTVRTDDPSLTVRHVKGHNPVRVIPTSTGQIPIDSQILNDGFPTIIAAPESASVPDLDQLRSRPNVEVLISGKKKVELRQLLAQLETLGFRSTLVEGGSELLYDFHLENLVGRAIVKHIPVISGHPEAPTYLSPGNIIGRLSISSWRLIESFAIGDVLIAIYEPRGSDR